MDSFPMPRVLDFPPRIDLQDRRRQLRNERERRKRRRNVIIIISTASIGCLALGLCSFLAFLAFINYSSSSDNASSSTTTSTTTSTTSTSTTTTTTTPCDDTLTYTSDLCSYNDGGLITNFPSSSAQECQDACTCDFPSCVVFYYNVDAEPPDCSLYDSSVQLQLDSIDGNNYMFKHDSNGNQIYTPST